MLRSRSRSECVRRPKARLPDDLRITARHSRPASRQSPQRPPEAVAGVPLAEALAELRSGKIMQIELKSSPELIPHQKTELNTWPGNRRQLMLSATA